MGKKGSAESRYLELSSAREPYLRRARECAKLTIPTLLMEEGSTAATKIRTPYQSAGAEGVNTLSSKLLITLFPPNQPFWRFTIDPAMYEEDPENEKMRSEIESALAKYERRAAVEIEQAGDRPSLSEAFDHLAVVGNVLLYDAPTALKVYHLDKFVCRRDPDGNPIEIIVHEQVNADALPPEFVGNIKANPKAVDKLLSVYTHLKRGNEEWSIYQECAGRKIPGSNGTYPLDACPWIPLRMIRVDGEDYGRSYVEMYKGDLASLEALTQAIVEGAAIAAKVLVFVNPNGQTQIRTVAKAKSGDVVEGIANDVTVLDMNKQADFAVAERMADKLERRLGRIFLQYTAVQRNAERVTQEEVRATIRELETALGGLYTILTSEFQLPYVKQKIAKLEKSGKLPPLPKDIVKPTIITGIEALGRGNDGEKLRRFLMSVRELVGPENLGTYLDVSDALTRLATADGIDTEGMIFSKEEIQQSQQAMQQQAMVGNLAPEMLKQAGGIVQSGVVPPEMMNDLAANFGG